MATLDLSAASNVLKEFYLPRLRLQLNDELSPTYTMLEKSSQNVEGEEVVHSIHTGRNPGTGSRVEFADLPTPGVQKYEKVRTDLKYHYGEVQFTGQVIRRAKSDRGSFINAAANEMDRLTTDLKHVMNRQLFNDASASLAIVDSVAGQDITLLNPTPEQLRSFVIGMALDIGTLGAPTAGADSVVLTAVNLSTGVLTVTGTITSVVNGHYIRMEDSFGAELTGLRQIISSGDSLFGVDGATVNPWNAYVNTAGSNRNPTELLLQTAIDEISIASGKVPSIAVAPHDVVRAYGAQLTSQKRYNDTRDLGGGFEGLDIATGSGKLTMVADRFAPSNTIHIASGEHLIFNEASDWEWMEEDGAILERVANKDAYHATMFKYCELTTDRRNAHGVIEAVSGASA